MPEISLQRILSGRFPWHVCQRWDPNTRRLVCITQCPCMTSCAQHLMQRHCWWPRRTRDRRSRPLYQYCARSHSKSHPRDHDLHPRSACSGHVALRSPVHSHSLAHTLEARVWNAQQLLEHELSFPWEILVDVPPCAAFNARFASWPLRFWVLDVLPQEVNVRQDDLSSSLSLPL